MSEGAASILSARVVNIRARLIGNMLIILSLLITAGVVYSTSLLRLDRAVGILEETLAQSHVVSLDQQATLFGETADARRVAGQIPLVWAVLVGIAVVAVTVITIRSIAQPTERLTAAAESLAEGKLEERVELQWADEFGRLGMAFNRMADRLQHTYSELEQKVIERTEALEQRSNQLEAAAQIARDATAIRDVNRLLAETVRLISDRFGFYHTGIFLLDEAKQYAVLHAASSEGGQRMLDREHRLRVGEAGIVGYVTKQGEARIALDVGQDAHFFDNPDLPDTRSEITLPLRVRGDIIGALDVQSTKPGAFGAEDEAVLQTLADQIAMAINNAQLFQQAQESLEAERRAYGELSRRAWQELLRGGRDLAQRYDPQGILPPGGQWRDTLKRAVHEGKVVADNGQQSAALAVPIQVREQVIGVLDAHKPREAGEWTREEIALIQTLADQLSVALDSARLYQDAQRRAAREQLVGEVTTRMRETLDLDTVLQTAVAEMRGILDLAEAEIHLELGQEAGDSTVGEAGSDGFRRQR